MRILRHGYVPKQSFVCVCMCACVRVCSVPFAIVALFFLPPSHNSNPGSQSRLYPPPSPLRFVLCLLYRTRLQSFLASSTRFEWRTRRPSHCSSPLSPFESLQRLNVGEILHSSDRSRPRASRSPPPCLFEMLRGICVVHDQPNKNVLQLADYTVT